MNAVPKSGMSFGGSSAKIQQYSSALDFTPDGILIFHRNRKVKIRVITNQ